MNENESIIYCSRCGSPMKSDARYCMKCGNLNYNHPDNKNMVAYKEKEKSQFYEIGSGTSIGNKTIGTNTFIQAKNPTNKSYFKIINLLAIIFGYGLILVLGFFKVINFIDVFSLLIGLSIYNIYIISLEIIFMKADEHWWAAIVPFYNLAILSKIVFGKAWLMILFFIPIVGFLYSLILFYKLGKIFNKAPILTMLFNLVYLPVIAFGSSLYKATIYVDGSDENSLEKQHLFNKKIFILLLIFLVAGVIGLVLINISIFQGLFGNFQNELIVDTANKVITKIDDKIQDNKFECSDGVDIFSNSEHYFLYYDVKNDLSLLGIVGDKPIAAVVRVTSDNGNMQYTISMSNGDIGLSGVRREDLNSDKVIKYESIPDIDLSKRCYVD